MEKLRKKGRSSHYMKYYKSSDKFVRGRVVKRYVVGGTFQVCYMRERRERSSSKFLHADCPRDYGRSSFLMNGLGEIYLTPPPDTPFPHTAWIRRRGRSISGRWAEIRMLCKFSKFPFHVNEWDLDPERKGLSAARIHSPLLGHRIFQNPPLSLYSASVWCGLPDVWKEQREALARARQREPQFTMIDEGAVPCRIYSFEEK